jgi:O-acetyl-ADP-ribose deacetylase (regulator of RNase III)
MSAGAALEFVRADITAQRVDAIVNAANSRLAHGGGVARAIALAAGPTFAEESLRHPHVPVGGAGHTAGGDLQCRHVIHAVGPRWSGGQAGEPELLASAYRSALLLAERLECRSIAFPSLATGIFGYPVREAAAVAVGTVRDTAAALTRVELVRFCLFSEDDLAAYRDAATGGE